MNIQFGELVVGQPDFMRALNSLLTQHQEQQNDLTDLRRYLTWQVVRQDASLLSSGFRNESQRWYDLLLGTSGASTRAGQCSAHVQSLLGDLLGRYFVSRYFSEDSRQEALTMVEQIKLSFLELLEQSQWLQDPIVREEARNKLFHIRNKIGYPDVWIQFEQVFIEPGRFYENVHAIQTFFTRQDLDRIGQPVDTGRWFMHPTEVNAYYEPTRNEIVFPAAILQFPFFHPHAPAWLNYGSIGAVIGHEITHGFDDQGRQYDASGRLRDWWSVGVSEAFEEQAQCVVDLYDSYEVLPGLHINGQLTLGENLADLGGMHIAYRAYDTVRRNVSASQQKLTDQLMDRYFPSFTEEQLFFVSYAQSWCTKARSAYLELLTATNPHAFAQFRVQGVVSNLPAFAEAFRCRPGQAMYADKPCQVW